MIPHIEHPTVLRNVFLGNTGYRLLTWDMQSTCSTGQWLVGYAFYEPGVEEALFKGEDYGCAPSHSIDSDDCLRGILNFLTLRLGDTDEEYFSDYTERQLAWSKAHAESLQIWGFEASFFEQEEDEPPQFVEIEP